MPTVEEVLERARAVGLLGRDEIAVHVRHARGYQRWLGMARRRVLDLGSGGGVPGLVLAADIQSAVRRGELPARDAPTWVLLDGRERPVEFLRWAIEKLGLQPVARVLHGRAEELARSELRASFDAVCARGFGRPGTTAECAAGFLRVGGLLIVSDPPGREAARARWPVDKLAELGFGVCESASADFNYQLLRMTGCCPCRFPRRSGVPAKRPLF